jgi:transcriptional regulator GlxA family with amidase domain
VDTLSNMLQEVRSCFASPCAEASDPDAAVRDPDIIQILEWMHAQPELPWTVASLADRICISRSRFAERFKTLLSKTPLQYLFELRMRNASAMLAEGRHRIKDVAARVGYSSEAAFSKAFKRWSGIAPGAYRQSTSENAGLNSSDRTAAPMSNC